MDFDRELMGAQGTATLNFGAFAAGGSPFAHPNTEASAVVTGQGGILAGSLVEAWISPPATASADHSIDEHRIENIQVRAGDITAGAGFTIYGECLLGGTYGAFTVNWVWN